MVTHSSLLTMIVNERCIDYHIRFYITVRVLYTQYNLMYAKINMDDEDMGDHVWLPALGYLVVHITASSNYHGQF